MADRNYRSDRSREGIARSTTEADPGERGDPLAALARLISESRPGADATRGPGQAQATMPLRTLPTPQTQYADTDERYEDGDQGVIESYDAPQLAEPLPSHPRGLAAAYEQASVEDQLAQLPPHFVSSDEDLGGYPEDEDQEPHHAADLQPAMLESAYADTGYGDPDRDRSESDEAGEYERDNKRRRRGGSVLVAAVIGLAVLGTAGAFAYRAMFGTSALPTLPPIIKASEEPNKIVPNSGAAAANGQAGAASAGAGGDRLVSREEQPVDVPKPVNPLPRVVSTIPVFPDPGAGFQGTQAGLPQGLPQGLPPVSAAPSGNPSAFGPAGADASAPQGQVTPPGAATGPKKIHTVVVQGQAGTDLSASPAAAIARAPSAAAAQHAATAAPAPKPSVAPPPRAPSGSGPLEIAPQPGDQQNPARTRTALAHAPAAAAPEAAGTEPTSAPPTASGGYAVQVSSQRSEAEAQSSYRALRAKYPDQLGGHEPIVRKADLGAKGIYYRALVGPFASADQAQALCASLKAAGGSCIVQKD